MPRVTSKHIPGTFALSKKPCTSDQFSGLMCNAEPECWFVRKSIDPSSTRMLATSSSPVLWEPPSPDILATNSTMSRSIRTSKSSTRTLLLLATHFAASLSCSSRPSSFTGTTSSTTATCCPLRPSAPVVPAPSASTSSTAPAALKTPRHLHRVEKDLAFMPPRSLPDILRMQSASSSYSSTNFCPCRRTPLKVRKNKSNGIFVMR
mmetsp:Transcript_19393/g.67548  ORF Transcript_19393/g.67548 Transcript_19393/m.67548 type:complete len:206 (-) Transcript_19393:658-1275(-)